MTARREDHRDSLAQRATDADAAVRSAHPNRDSA